MSFINLFLHQIKAFIRHENWRRNLFAKIILSIVGVNTIFLFLFLGIFMSELLPKSGNNPIDTFNSFLLLYLAVDLFLRFFMQPLPSLHIAHYLRLSISRNDIVLYLLFRSFFNLFNLLPWLVLIPVANNIIMPIYGFFATFIYVVIFLLLLIFNNVIAVLFGLLSAKNIGYILFALAIPIAMVLLGLEHLFAASISLGNWLLNGNLIFVIILLTLISSIFIIIFYVLKNELYINDLPSNKQFQLVSQIIELNFFKLTGKINHLIWLEISLLLRNKRTRQTFSSIPIFICYFIFIIFNDHGSNRFLFLFLMSFGISFGAAIYGQLIFSWESAYFDSLMILKINFSDYIKAKFYIISALTLLTTLLFSATLLITNRNDLPLLFSFFVFNLGVTPFVILLFACFNDGRIDLGEKQYFSYQGLQGSQMFLSLVLILLPISVYKLFVYIVDAFTGEIVLIIIGSLFFIYHNWWIKKIIAKLFFKRKYKNLEGYRKLYI